MAKANPAPHHADELDVRPVVDHHLVTLNSIADGLALIDSLIGKDAPETPLDLLAAEIPETMNLAGRVRVLTEILVDGIANARAADVRAAERSEAIDAVNAAVRQAGFRINRRARRDALGDAGELIREIGLEFHDLQCILATSADDKDVIVIDPVPAPVAHIWLIERLLQRMDALVSVDENLIVERSASAWFFDCWSDGTQPGDPAHVEFPRMVREQEWSLVSRDTLSLDEPVISLFTPDQRPDDVPPRQQRLAAAYVQSTVGVFEIVAVDGPYGSVRDLSSGQTHRYYEHSEDADLRPGLLILGRMIPLQDDLWLRSPGALIVSSPDDGFRDHLSTTLTNLCESLPTPIALEALISLAVYRAMVPVARLPAPTIAAAQATLADVDDMLDAIGLFDIDDAEIPEDEYARRNDAEQERFEQRVDQPMSDWINALSGQVDLDRPRPDAHAAKRKHKQKQRRRAKQQHKRRRK